MRHSFLEKCENCPALDVFFRLLIVIIFSTIYSLAVVWFVMPANLMSIGLTGTGQIISMLIGLAGPEIPVGVFVLLLNIPLFIYGIKSVSPKFILYSCVSVIVQSICMMGWIKKLDLGIDYEQNRLFLAIMGGLIAGFAVGGALRFGTSTGGMDILAQALNLKKGISIGQIEMLINVLIAIFGAFLVDGNRIMTMLYTFIFLLITNIVVDKVHTSYNYLRIDVVTTKANEVSQAMISEIKRGCTILDVKGAYTKENKYDIFMVVSSYELEKAKKVIASVDPNAFIMVLPVKRIIGAFFKHTIT